MRRHVFDSLASLLLTGTLLLGLACSGTTGPAPRDAEWEAPEAEGPWLDDPSIPWMEVVVDLTAVHDGRVPVSFVVSGLSFEESELRLTGEERGYAIHDLRITDEQGRPVEYKRRDRRFPLGPVEGSVLKVRYECEPGGPGRWGHQGILLDDWATFDGRLVLMPKRAHELRAVRIRYVTPDGWTVTSPFRREGEWHYTDTYGPEHAADTLSLSCVGLGNFEERTRRYGDMEVRVAGYKEWPDAYRAMLFTKSFRLLDYFHETLGFDLGAPHIVVWLPTHEGNTVYGGAHSNGNCLDNPDQKLRDWQLLAHRIAHGMNKYPPSGMRIRDHEDEWFKEGWPCYTEIAATFATGIAEDDSYFNYLYSNYKDNTRTRPDIDMALGKGHTPDGTIHMHYRKAPLAVKMLDELMTARSGRTMAEFIYAMWPKYGWYREPFPVKEELEAFTGASFEDFWSVVVRRKGVMAPVTGEFVTEQMRSTARHLPAARVDGEPISGDYLYHLARSGDFESYASIRDFLVAELANRRDLAAHDVRVFPEELLEQVYVLPPEERYAMARIDAAFAEQLAQAGARTSGRSDAARLRLEIDESHRDGRIFAALIAAEGANARTASGIVVRIGDDADARTGPGRLAFGRDAQLLLQTELPSSRDDVEVEILSDDRITKSWTIEDGSTAKRALMAVDPTHRGADASSITIRVRAGEETVSRRVYWQRGTEPEPVEIVLEADRALRESANRAIEEARKDPKSAVKLYRKGLSQARLGHHRMAAKAFAQSLRLDDRVATRWKDQGVSLNELGEYGEALESFDRALELNPQFIQARFERLISLAGLGRRDECLAALDALLDDLPDSPMRSMWRARTLMALGDHAEALPSNRKFVEQLPSRASGWIDLGRTLLQLERYEESVDAYDKALELDPANTRARAERDEAFTALLRR